MRHACIAGVIALGLSACGGGGGNADGGNGTLPVAASPATPLSAYIGNWTGPCIVHQIETRTITRTPGRTDAITIANKADYYANHDCTGAVVGTLTQSANATAVYTGTVPSSIVFTEGSAAVPAIIDGVSTSLPQHTLSVTGTGVSYIVGGGLGQWCIHYADGDGSCVSDLGPASAGIVNPAALYLQGTTMYELRWNGSSYSVNWTLKRQ